MKSITVDDGWDLEAEDGWLVDARGRFSSLGGTQTARPRRSAPHGRD